MISASCMGRSTSHGGCCNSCACGTTHLFSLFVLHPTYMCIAHSLTINIELISANTRAFHFTSRSYECESQSDVGYAGLTEYIEVPMSAILRATSVGKCQ